MSSDTDIGNAVSSDTLVEADSAGDDGGSPDTAPVTNEDPDKSESCVLTSNESETPEGTLTTPQCNNEPEAENTNTATEVALSVETVEVVTSSTGKPSDGDEEEKANKSDTETSSTSRPNGQEAVSAKVRAGRGYQENRRSKKSSSGALIAAADKTKSSVVGAKYERTRCSDVDDSGTRATNVIHIEQRAKGDVEETSQRAPLDSDDKDMLRSEKGATCRPTCDGDPSASLNPVIDDRELQKSGQELLKLIKQAPSSDKRSHAKEDRGRGTGRELRHKAKPASELEAEWQREADLQKSKEEEAKKKKVPTATLR